MAALCGPWSLGILAGEKPSRSPQRDGFATGSPISFVGLLAIGLAIFTRVLLIFPWAQLPWKSSAPRRCFQKLPSPSASTSGSAQPSAPCDRRHRLGRPRNPLLNQSKSSSSIRFCPLSGALEGSALLL